MTSPEMAVKDSAHAPVVVGVDNSRLGMSAVRLAVREAALRQRPLRIVHSFNWVSDPGEPIEHALRTPGEELIDRAVATARETESGVEITSALIEGPAVTTMLRESGSAALTVIGDGNLADCDCIPAETSSVQIASRAGSSVLVVREKLPEPGPVLVGFDGSTSCYAAVDFAFEAAARRGRELVVVRAWDPIDTPGEVEAGTVEQLGEAIAPWRHRYPSLAVRLRVQTGDPKSTLVDESRQAELAVVSARGEQPWRGLLGAVSQALLYHSPAPVLIVRSAHELYVQE